MQDDRLVFSTDPSTGSPGVFVVTATGSRQRIAYVPSHLEPDKTLRRVIADYWRHSHNYPTPLGRGLVLQLALDTPCDEPKPE